MSLFDFGRGQGISKEDAAKRNYFDIFFRHFRGMVLVNLLYFALNAVFFGISAWLFLGYITNLNTIFDTVLQGKMFLLSPLPFLPFMLIGPTTAGLTYVLRTWARQEPVFILSEFFEHTKQNLKQGLILSVLNTAIIYVLLNAVLFYLHLGTEPLLVLMIALPVFALFFIMNFYTYPMAVTFKMGLKDILVNACIFAIIKLPQNLFFLLILVLVHGFLLFMAPIVWAILMAVVLISWSGYTMNYYAWHVMNKYLMPTAKTID